MKPSTCGTRCKSFTRWALIAKPTSALARSRNWSTASRWLSLLSHWTPISFLPTLGNGDHSWRVRVHRHHAGQGGGANLGASALQPPRSVKIGKLRAESGAWLPRADADGGRQMRIAVPKVRLTGREWQNAGTGKRLGVRPHQCRTKGQVPSRDASLIHCFKSLFQSNEEVVAIDIWIDRAALLAEDR